MRATSPDRQRTRAETESERMRRNTPRKLATRCPPADAAIAWSTGPLMEHRVSPSKTARRCVPRVAGRHQCQHRLASALVRRCLRSASRHEPSGQPEWSAPGRCYRVRYRRPEHTFVRQAAWRRATRSVPRAPAARRRCIRRRDAPPGCTTGRAALASFGSDSANALMLPTTAPGQNAPVPRRCALGHASPRTPGPRRRQGCGRRSARNAAACRGRRRD